MDVKKLSDLELGKYLAEQQAQFYQIQKNIELLSKELQERLEAVKKEKSTHD